MNTTETVGITEWAPSPFFRTHTTPHLPAHHLGEAHIPKPPDMTPTSAHALRGFGYFGWFGRYCSTYITPASETKLPFGAGISKVARRKSMFCHPAGHPQISGGRAPLGWVRESPSRICPGALRGATHWRGATLRQKNLLEVRRGSCAQLHSAGGSVARVCEDPLLGRGWGHWSKWSRQRADPSCPRS